MAHAGIINIWQDGQDIMVIKCEANREGQDVFGNVEETDGLARPLGRAQAW